MRVLHIDCDSQRPDHLGRYGYGRDTLPNVNRIADAGPPVHELLRLRRSLFPVVDGFEERIDTGMDESERAEKVSPYAERRLCENDILLSNGHLILEVPKTSLIVHHMG